MEIGTVRLRTLELDDEETGKINEAFIILNKIFSEDFETLDMDNGRQITRGELATARNVLYALQQYPSLIAIDLYNLDK